jgi:hypothetical protein
LKIASQSFFSVLNQLAWGATELGGTSDTTAFQVMTYNIFSIF